jgi:hypothetical protein
MAILVITGLAFSVAAQESKAPTHHKGNVGGYTRAGVGGGQTEYNAGFSFYSAVWPLLQEYHGHSFQSGLFGTWMGVQNDKKAPGRFYTKIEGGLGWWRDTEFPTETPKFIMGGVALNFSAWANGPGAGKGRNWEEPKGKYGIAQLSPWLLWPPDGLNLKQGACGELFGYGYLPLPLTKEKSTTVGKNVPTGNQCWTLFLNTGNFKGPVAFFTPYFWSRASVDDPRLSGMFLDTRPSAHNRPLSMETQHISCVKATDSKGQSFLRTARTLFPVEPDGNSLLVHRVTSYSKKALWDGVDAWMKGGDPVDGAFDPKGTFLHQFSEKGGPSWKVWMRQLTEDKIVGIDTKPFVNPYVTDPETFGFQWNNEWVTRTKSKTGSLVTLPEYYKMERSEKDGTGTWVPVAAKDVSAETDLAEINFSRPKERPPLVYVTPEDPESCWKKPGPAVGPFKADLGDGSTVTYYWYRFADQPALLNADMTDKERENLQKRVEKIHRRWTMDREYLAPPTVGTLADIDPALIVTPPKGLEVGYVPIATRQGVNK